MGNSAAHEGSDTIISASSDNTLKVWDMSMLASYRTLEGHKGAVKGVARVDTSKVLSCGDDKAVLLWDITDGTYISFSGHNNPVESVVAMESYIITGDSEGHLRIYDKRKTEAPIHCIRPHTRPIRKMIKLNQTCVATASIDGKITVTSTLTAQPLRVMTNNEAIHSFGQLSDNRLLVVGTESQINIWDAQTGKRVHTTKRDAPTHAVLGRAESGLFIAGVEDRMNGAIVMMHYKQGIIKRFQATHNGKVLALAHMAPKHLFVSGCSDGAMKIWDVNDPQKSVLLDGHERSLNALTFL
jgi:WD40 repeat protein